ncbi:MAG: N-acetylglucosamine-6-phosphate deacetylase [Oscillospiraceae bacterium]|nr:N-acetylglucosamine-6-phosphate deacetylase [Oscillospiraceae bacterium]
MKIKVGRAYSDGHILDADTIEIENGVFKSVSNGGDAELDFSGYIALPGFIDMHTHGAIGFEANTASFEEFDKLSEFYASNGVAEFCVTTVTDTIDNLVEIEKLVAKRIREGTSGARIAGIYLEGPFLSHKLRGAHNENLLANPAIKDIDRLIEAGNGNLRVIAIAPETEGAYSAMEYAASKGIKVACGHSAATCAEANAAFDAGASVAIHTYNCMSPLHHREPGVVGASLVRDDVYNEIICDFIHVAPEAVKVALRCKGKDKIVFITDSIGAAGLADGEYQFGPLPIIVKDGIARIAEGNLAGSSLRTNVALRNVVTKLGMSLEDAMLGVTKNPAEALGMYDKIGSIAPGKRAHLTVVDDDFNVVMTIVDGRIVYEA